MLEIKQLNILNGFFMKQIMLFFLFLFCLNIQAQEPINEKSPIFLYASGGIGYKVAKIAPNLGQNFKDIERNLKFGFIYEGGIGYNFNEQRYIKAVFNSFNSSANYNVISIGFENVVGKINQTINFYGLTYGEKYALGQKENKFILEVGLGYNTFNQKTKVESSQNSLTGGNLAVLLNTGFLFQVSNTVALGPNLGYIASSLNKFKIGNETFDLGDDKEGLSRLNLTFNVIIDL